MHLLDFIEIQSKEGTRCAPFNWLESQRKICFFTCNYGRNYVFCCLRDSMKMAPEPGHGSGTPSPVLILVAEFISFEICGFKNFDFHTAVSWFWLFKNILDSDSLLRLSIFIFKEIIYCFVKKLNHKNRVIFLFLPFFLIFLLYFVSVLKPIKFIFSRIKFK